MATALFISPILRKIERNIVFVLGNLGGNFSYVT